MILQIIADSGKAEEFEALIDPSSYSVDNGSSDYENSIVSYISEDLASEIRDTVKG